MFGYSWPKSFKAVIWFIIHATASSRKESYCALWYGGGVPAEIRKLCNRCVGVWTSFVPFPYLMCHLYPFISNEKKKRLPSLCFKSPGGAPSDPCTAGTFVLYAILVSTEISRTFVYVCVFETSLFGGVSFRRFRVAVAILECYKRRADHQKWQAMAL